jgi:hypothetical protein
MSVLGLRSSCDAEDANFLRDLVTAAFRYRLDAIRIFIIVVRPCFSNLRNSDAALRAEVPVEYVEYIGCTLLLEPEDFEDLVHAFGNNRRQQPQEIRENRRRQHDRFVSATGLDEFTPYPESVKP